MTDLWIMVVVGSLGTYVWRGLGVVLAGRLEPGGEAFRWITCVAYAMIAGLVARIIVLPTGPLAASLFWHRLAACLIGLVIYRFLRGNVFVAVGTGAASLAILNELRGVFG